MVETSPQLSSNSSSGLETSAVGEKEKPIREEERRKDLEVIYHSELNNPEVGFTDFLSFARSMCLFEGIGKFDEYLANALWKTSEKYICLSSSC